MSNQAKSTSTGSTSAWQIRTTSVTRDVLSPSYAVETELNTDKDRGATGLVRGAAESVRTTEKFYCLQ